MSEIFSPETIDISGRSCLYQPLYFNRLKKQHIYGGSVKKKLGKPSDLVVNMSLDYPEVIGFFIDHGWGQHLNEFISWDKVIKIEEDDGIFVSPNPEGEMFPPFVEGPGSTLLGEHLIGRTILDIDGRTTEVVNDIVLVWCDRRLYVTHIDTSFNGFLRQFGSKKGWFKDNLVEWKYVQVFTVKDSDSTDKVSLTITRREVENLPPIDLAIALERLRKGERTALFSSLSADKAASTLAQAEPRTQRQIVATLEKGRAHEVFSKMRVPHIADLLSIVSFQDRKNLLNLLEPGIAKRVKGILSERDARASLLMTPKFVKVKASMTIGEACSVLQASGRETDDITYIYVVDDDDLTLLGVVDSRDLLLKSDDYLLSDILIISFVTVPDDANKQFVVDIFERYDFRAVPVVNDQNHIVGVLRFADIMKSRLTSLKKSQRRI